MFIQQISVFLENNPGTLWEMTDLLGRNGVDLLALALADTQSFGIVRIIVHSDQIDPAVALLRENGYIAKINRVICAPVPDRPRGLSELLAIIDQAGLSVEYMYSFLRTNDRRVAHMILRFNDGQKAAQVFEMKGITMLSQEDVDAL